MRIEDYALIGDLQSAALVGTDGSVDWMCVPRFDSPACFAALLGDSRHGRWLISPVGGVRGVARAYRSGTLVLETEFSTSSGVARIVDFMPRRGGGPPRLGEVQDTCGRGGTRSWITSAPPGASPTTASGKPRRHYTYSKVMAWVVFDRAVRLAERFGLEAPVECWVRTRDEIHAEVCERGYDPTRGTFTQYYASDSSRRSTTSTAGGRSANSRRRSATWR